MTDPSRMTMTALELRSGFDQAYAVPPPLLASEGTESLLAIRLAGDPYAIRVSQITGLASDKKIVALPCRMPELLGIVGIRGDLIPIYNLAALVGHDRHSNHTRWLVLCGTDELIGFAFSEFEGYLKVASIQVYAASQNHVIREHVRDAVRIRDVVRAIINIPSVVETIEKRCGQDRIPQEH